MPSDDFGTHDPEFTEAQRAQCERIIDAVRELNARVVRLGGSLDELTVAADRIEQLRDALEPVTRSRALESFRDIAT